LAVLVDEIGETALGREPADKTVVFDNAVDPAFLIDADREQLYRILLNIIRNAFDAVKDLEYGNIAVEAARAVAGVAIRVRDSGRGIPDSVQAKLFQPFVASTRSAGTGLGLAIARDLARAHGGDVVLESTGASGTCFRVDIPDSEKTR
jgi:signal transduction histidine kinase